MATQTAQMLGATGSFNIGQSGGDFVRTSTGFSSDGGGFGGSFSEGDVIQGTSGPSPRLAFYIFKNGQLHGLDISTISTLGSLLSQIKTLGAQLQYSGDPQLRDQYSQLMTQLTQAVGDQLGTPVKRVQDNVLGDFNSLAARQGMKAYAGDALDINTAKTLLAQTNGNTQTPYDPANAFYQRYSGTLPVSQFSAGQYTGPTPKTPTEADIAARDQQNHSTYGTPLQQGSYNQTAPTSNSSPQTYSGGLKMPPSTSTGSVNPLMDIYNSRPDLQAVYNPDGSAKNPNDPRIAGIPTLQAWAAKYGAQENPSLSAYANNSVSPQPSGTNNPNQNTQSSQSTGLQMPPVSVTSSSVVQDGGQIDLSRGDQFLVRYPSSHGNTVYLYDKNLNTNIPFTSTHGEGFIALMGETPEQALANGTIHDLPSPINGSSIAPDQYGFNDQGQLPNQSYYSNLRSIQGTYGKNRSTDLEQQASDDIGKFFVNLVNQHAISQQTFDNYIKNPQNLAKYVNAWVYGGYTADDIFRDIKAKELGINADIIDPTQTADKHNQSTDYATAKSNVQLNPPQNLNIDPEFFNNPLFSIPGDAFKTLVPVIDNTTTDFKNQANQIKDEYHDLLLQQLNAKTSQDKAIADDNYKQFKDQIQKQYGIQLSDNATSAWNQISQLSASTSDAGTLNSGIFNEALDKVLAARRQADQRVRDTEITQSDQQKRQYYLTSASADQIQNDLTPQQRQAWGLTPPQDVLDFVNNLKSNYPDLTDDQIQQIRDSLIDQNGNLRSSLYQNLYSNKYNLTQQKQAYQQGTLLNQKISETEKAYAPYTKSDNPYIRFNQSINPTQPAVSNTPTTPTGVSVNVGNILGNTTNNNQPTPPSGTPSTGLQMPATTNGILDLSSKYGLHNGTVYNKQTYNGYSNSQDFFKDAGVNSFSNIKLDTSYQPKFYKYNDSPLVYNGYNDQPLNNNQYLLQGGDKNYGGIETRNR